MTPICSSSLHFSYLVSNVLNYSYHGTCKCRPVTAVDPLRSCLRKRLDTNEGTHYMSTTIQNKHILKVKNLKITSATIVYYPSYLIYQSFKYSNHQYKILIKILWKYFAYRSLFHWTLQGLVAIIVCMCVSVCEMTSFSSQQRASPFEIDFMAPLGILQAFHRRDRTNNMVSWY